jgi:membrane protease YdiL (CAAX protease family)
MEQKELLIFLMVAFGMPLIMTIPLALTYTAGEDTSVFAGAQMLYPATGVILAVLLCRKDRSLVPQKLFGAFLLLSLLSVLWCFTGIFLPDELVANGFIFLEYGGSLVFLGLLFFEDQEKLNAYGLSGSNWRTSFFLLVSFVSLFLFSVFIALVLATDVITAGHAVLQVSNALLPSFSMFPLLIVYFFGEEYGWRYYFQPLLQKKFGLINGVLLFGLLWSFWHLPLALFYYTLTAKVTTTTALAQLLLVSLVNTTILGIIMAYAYMKTHNVWLPVLIHFLNNNLTSVSENDQETALKTLVVWTLIKMILFLPLLCSKVFKSPKAVSGGVVGVAPTIIEDK